MSEKQPDSIVAASPAMPLTVDSALSETTIFNMGFPTNQVILAMNAAQFNQVLALEYLRSVSLEVLKTVIVMSIAILHGKANVVCRSKSKPPRMRRSPRPNRT
jgi:hypothetical protein